PLVRPPAPSRAQAPAATPALPARPPDEQTRRRRAPTRPAVRLQTRRLSPQGLPRAAIATHVRPLGRERAVPQLRVGRELRVLARPGPAPAPQRRRLDTGSHGRLRSLSEKAAVRELAGRDPRQARGTCGGRRLA